MKTNFIFLFFILILVNGVISTGFSPTSLVYELEENEEECKTVIVNSESEKITVLDKWAENKDIEWKVSLFEEESSYHGISIDYQEELVDENKVEVCLSGSKSGEYHGVLLLREEQEGNSVVQMGVWLKATIESKEVVQPSSGSSGGSSSGGLSYEEVVEESKEEVQEEVVEEKEVVENTQEIIDKNINEEENKITGQTVTEDKTNFAWFAIPVILIILTIIIIIFKKK